MNRNGSANRSGNWIFQGNPSRYTLIENLGTQATELWNLRQHADEVWVGDTVYIWISGEEAGIYAVGTVVTGAQLRQDSPSGIRSWTDPREGLQARPRVEIRYDRLLLDRPLLKVFIRTDAILRDLRILRAPRGTNYQLTQLEADAIEEWLAVQP
jgi:hypothetical protein